MRHSFDLAAQEKQNHQLDVLSTQVCPIYFAELQEQIGSYLCTVYSLLLLTSFIKQRTLSLINLLHSKAIDLIAYFLNFIFESTFFFSTENAVSSSVTTSLYLRA